MDAFPHLKSHEALAAAIGVEREHARRYQQWSVRMAPFDKAASALLKELADEERDHEQQLADVYRDKFGEPIEHADPAEFQLRIEMHTFMHERHFFVVNESMAGRILASALQTEIGNLEFYERLGSSTDDTDLKMLYESLATFERDHRDALLKRLAPYSPATEHRAIEPTRSDPDARLASPRA